MIVLVATIIGLVVWLTAWAFGIKAFDAFLFTGFLILAAAAIHITLPFVRQIIHGKPVAPGE